jgi:hypothetical protein
MGAARWVVIGTAIAAAATASYMLMGPGPDTPRGVDPSSGIPEAASAPPQDQIDADSRAAMRDFLRQSLHEPEEEEVEEGNSDW